MISVLWGCINFISFGLFRSEINHTTYRTQVELDCPDMRSTTRPSVPKSSWFVPIWDQPHDLSYPGRVGLSRSEIKYTTYRTYVELVCPDLRSITRPIVPKSSWFVPIWDHPHDLSYPCRVGLSRSEIKHTTYRTQVELVCPDLRSNTRPMVPKSCTLTIASHMRFSIIFEIPVRQPLSCQEKTLVEI